ncbi:cysteine hydrolase family protein [Rhodococcus koreensis]
MSDSTYPLAKTGLIVVDATNDFISEGGKLWSAVEEVCTAVGVLPNMARALAAARDAGITVLHAPMETNPWDYGPWQNKSLTHNLLQEHQLFQAGTWGAEFHPDFEPHEGEVVVVPHKAFDAFHGTDLDTQLRQRNIDHVIIMGMTTNTCVDSTGRDAYEKGYHVTYLSDAVGAFSMEAHTATIDLDWPRYAHEVLSTEELVTRLKASSH